MNGPMKKYTARYYERDVETIRQFFPCQGYNEVFRRVIHRFAENLRKTRGDTDDSEELERLVDDQGIGVI